MPAPKVSLALKQSQKLALTPQMQQAIALLQLTNQQLTQQLAQEMEKNPFLAFDMSDYKEHGYKQSGVASTSYSSVDAGQVIEETQSAEVGLREHLQQQIILAIRERKQQALATALIDWLDDDGYLRDSEEEICAALNVAPALLQKTLAKLQTLEPAGIFARSLAECLALQCKRAGRWNAAFETLLAHLAMLAAGDTHTLADLCGVEVATLREMVAFIRCLNPRPAEIFTQDASGIAPPDILVAKEKGVWRAQLNDDTLPKVLVLEREWEEMAKRKMHDKERSFLKSNIGAARWLRHAAKSRAATLLRVADAVVAIQQNFMQRGAIALAPMTMREVGVIIDAHESTVSRAVANKLIATPHGLLELKSLFSAALGVNSPQSVKARIAEWIAGEDRTTLRTTLSDAAITKRLTAEGIPVARRTIAKYRTELGLPTAQTRHRLASLEE